MYYYLNDHFQGQRVNKCLLMVLQQLIFCRKRNAIARRFLLKQM